jgi:hypothetical protein
LVTGVDDPQGGLAVEQSAHVGPGEGLGQLFEDGTHEAEVVGGVDGPALVGAGRLEC